MNKLALLVLAALLSSGVAWAQEPGSREELMELKPFTPQTNYMSLPGYLRHLNHREAGRWLPTQSFNFIAAGHQLFQSYWKVNYDMGDFGQIGDVEAATQGAIVIMGHLIRTFPGQVEYRIAWFYTFSVGEGQYQSEYPCEITYNRQSRVLHSIDGSVYRLNEKGVFEVERIK